MKVFIAVDMEGIAGLVTWDGTQRELERQLMTEEVNAAARGAFAGGATEVRAGESHGNMRNLLPDLLDERVGFLSGQPKPMNHMGGVDGSFDLALFVGYHSRAGTLHGVMAHTYAGYVFSLSFNGVEVGEIGADAALCGAPRRAGGPGLRRPRGVRRGTSLAGRGRDGGCQRGREPLGGQVHARDAGAGRDRGGRRARRAAGIRVPALYL